MSEEDPHFKCLIRNISPETTKEELQVEFSDFGEVIDAKIEFDPTTGRSNEHGSVTFKEEKGRDRAVEVMNGKVFNGSVLQVYRENDLVDLIYTPLSRRIAPPRNKWTWFNYQRQIPELAKDGASKKMYFRCRVEDLPPDTTKEQLYVAFSDFGEVMDAKVYEGKEVLKGLLGVSTGLGHIDFKEKVAMDNAIFKMNGRQFCNSKSRIKVFDSSNPPISPENLNPPTPIPPVNLNPPLPSWKFLPPQSRPLVSSLTWTTRPQPPPSQTRPQPPPSQTRPQPPPQTRPQPSGSFFSSGKSDGRTWKRKSEPES